MTPLALLLLTATIGPGQATASEPDHRRLADRALAILRDHCHHCHGENGSAKGGMNYVLNPFRLVEAGKIVAGKPAESPLLAAVKQGHMPPPGSGRRLTDAEIADLERWIAAGALPWTASLPRQVITEAEVLEHIFADLMRRDRRARRFQRYFTFVHLSNAGISEEDLETHRQALAKLVNSLSWHPRMTRPEPVDPARTIFRIDLRDFQWDANLWNRLLAEYPYGVVPEGWTGKAIIAATGTRLPMLRGDWFLATASRPPLYHDILQLPATAAELERQLRVDVLQNITQERVARAGFNNSGVSRNNRLIERHYAAHGAYWKTYDFEAVPTTGLERQNLLPDRRNLFAFPLGPGISEKAFSHAGGEIIFNLPNGLHAFMLVDAVGNRIAKGPLAIVSDPGRPDRAVETGVSCFSCHYTGILFKDDQVRDHVARNRNGFTEAEADLITSLYVPQKSMRKLMEEDAERYRQAVEKAGAKVQTPEQIGVCVRRYEGPLDLRSAAAEVDTSPERLAEAIRRSESLTRSLGSLLTAGGSVNREVFLQCFADLISAARGGQVIPPGPVTSLPDITGELDPLEGISGPANAAAFAPDGRFVLFACSDKSIVVWDVLRNLEVRRLVGHTASVWSVAISPDGREALSGSADGTVRLWDLATGQELLKLEGHRLPVSSLAFIAAGARIAAGDFEGTISLWDRSTATLVARVQQPLPFVAAIAEVTGKEGGPTILAAGGMKLVRLGENFAPQEDLLPEFSSNVSSVTLSRDGRLLVVGSDSGEVRVWDCQTDQEVWRWAGHSSGIVSLTVDLSRGAVLAAGTDGVLQAWDLRTGGLLKKMRSGSEPVLATFLTPDGQYLLAATRDLKVRWLKTDQAPSR